MIPMLQDKVAIVTGASRGIGRAITQRLAREGCKVVINYSKDESGAKKTQRLVGKVETLLVQADITKVAECKKLVEQTLEKFGKIDILINNAGILIPKHLDETTEEDWDSTLNINLKAAFFLSKYASKHMKGGSIVSISSIRALQSARNRVAYSASKAGIGGLTKSLAIDLAEKGIRVNAIAPHTTDTDILKTVPKEVVDSFKEATLLKRLAKPEDIANAVAFLVSDEASFIDGQTIFVDGGATCW